MKTYSIAKDTLKHKEDFEWSIYDNIKRLDIKRLFKNIIFKLKYGYGKSSTYNLGEDVYIYLGNRISYFRKPIFIPVFIDNEDMIENGFLKKQNMNYTNEEYFKCGETIIDKIKFYLTILLSSSNGHMKNIDNIEPANTNYILGQKYLSKYLIKCGG